MTLGTTVTILDRSDLAQRRWLSSKRISCLKRRPKLSFTAGQFGTHIGYEVIDAPVNYNYSLSNLFNNGPFYHIGLKAQYAFTDRASLMLGLVNNVDNLYDNNKKKGLIGQFFFSPAANWSVYLNGIMSNEASKDVAGPPDLTNPPAVPASNALYQLYDLTTTYQVTPKFFLGLNAATGSQKGDYQGGSGPLITKSWSGVAVYTNYAFTDKFGMGARIETFDNKNGVRAITDADGNGASVTSITITGNINAADGHILFKPEFRVDTYSADKFEKNSGSLTTAPGYPGYGRYLQVLIRPFSYSKFYPVQQKIPQSVCKSLITFL